MASQTTLVIPTFQHTWGIHRGTSLHLFLFVGLKTRFNNPQGLAAVRLRQWEDSTTELDDDELTVYGVNSGEHNIIYNTSMYSLGIYGEEGEGKGQFRSPRGIAADEFGNVYLADTGNHRVVHLLNTGKELVWARTIGSPGDGPGHFRSPSGVALNSQGRLYVSDTDNHRIQVFDSHGQYLMEIGGPLRSPQGIAVIDSGERWSYYRENYLCAVDSGGRRLQKISLKGDILQTVAGQRTGMSDVRFGYVAIDFYGNVWVTDRDNHCVHKFDRDLNFVVSFGGKGKGDAEFLFPRGIAIWRRFGQVFVAEEAGAQYYWVGVDLLRVEVNPIFGEEGIKINFFLTERAYLTVDIWDNHGKLVKTLVVEKEAPIGSGEYRWNGLNAQGEAMPPGQYKLRIVAQPTYSSYHYFQRLVEKRVKL
jgi:streptogramin lyase